MSLIPFMLVAAVPLPAITAEEAIANFNEQYRLAREGVCGSASDPETIVVCGNRLEESPYRIAPSTGGYRPPPPTTQLFEFNLGPFRVGCCALSTSNGTGAGLSISTRF